MTKRTRVALAFCSLLALAGCNDQVSIAEDGPFGLRSGMSKKQLEGHLRENKKFLPSGDIFDNGNYFLENPPIPNSEVVYYTAKISDYYGLCWVKATGKKVETDDDGEDLKDLFLELEEVLDEKFGVHTRHDDEPITLGLFDKPKTWMEGLSRNLRKLSSVWDGSDDSDLPDNIYMVSLKTHALGEEAGYFTIEYYFTSYDECNQDITAKFDKKMMKDYNQGILDQYNATKASRE